jgi:NAD(P)-dependent dehydrogenase (short-subunit alcohol dehydrogenase family)
MPGDVHVRGTNHLGHFALTGLLLAKITDRIVTVSSGAHRVGKINFDDLNYERRRYERWSAYAQSKLANLMFAYELDRRLRAASSPLKSLAAHPGYPSTELQSTPRRTWIASWRWAIDSSARARTWGRCRRGQPDVGRPISRTVRRGRSRPGAGPT